LAEISENGEDETSKVEIFRDVILAFLNSLVDVSYGLIEVVFVEVKNGAIIEKGRNMVVGELRQMANTSTQILYSFLQKVVFRGRVACLLEIVLNDIKSEVEVRLRLVWY